MIDCVILAGGKGTRIRNVLGNTIKPMAKINGVPFIEIIINYFKKYGINNFILCVGYKAEQISSYLGDGEKLGVNIKYVFEDENKLLGTGGAIKNALPYVSSSYFMVANGDSICLTDFTKFFNYSLKQDNLVSILAAHIDNVSRYGSLKISKNSYLISFDEKSKVSIPGLINAGIYLFPSHIDLYFPSYSTFSIEKDFFPSLLDKKIYVYKTNDPFIDIGLPEDLIKASEFFKLHS